jgi:hypothetical protein
VAATLPGLTQALGAMSKSFAFLITVSALFGCSQEVTVQGTVGGSDGSVPEFCMLMVIGDQGVLHTAHFPPPEFKVALPSNDVREGKRLVVDCGGYSRWEVPVHSKFNGSLGDIVLTPSSGT